MKLYQCDKTIEFNCDNHECQFRHPYDVYCKNTKTQFDISKNVVIKSIQQTNVSPHFNRERWACYYMRKKGIGLYYFKIKEVSR